MVRLPKPNVPLIVVTDEGDVEEAALHDRDATLVGEGDIRGRKGTTSA